jgi:alkylation response protein AidB-like acyl-CoA dehydrogenase
MILNSEQESFRGSVGSFLAAKSPISALRALRDKPVETAYDRDLWGELAMLGVSSITVPAASGGAEFGWLALGAVAQEVGRRLSPTPLLSSVVLAQGALIQCASPAQVERYLPALLNGDEVWAVAFEEQARFLPDCLQTVMTPLGLCGRKVMVFDGAAADRLLVTALDGSGQWGLLLVDPGTSGINQQASRLMDGRQYVAFEFSEVSELACEWVAGPASEGAWDRVLNQAMAVLAAEMLGSARELFERTIEHLKEREQFDVKIGSFQALQHRAAHMYSELELSQAAVDAALMAFDSDGRDQCAMASAAKALANECFQLVSDEAVQMHGGMGVTDELDIGLFLKRSRVCNQLLGDTHWHDLRYADRLGF